MKKMSSADNGSYHTGRGIRTRICLVTVLVFLAAYPSLMGIGPFDLEIKSGDEPVVKLSLLIQLGGSSTQGNNGDVKTDSDDNVKESAESPDNAVTAPVPATPPAAPTVDRSARTLKVVGRNIYYNGSTTPIRPESLTSTFVYLVSNSIPLKVDLDYAEVHTYDEVTRLIEESGVRIQK